MSRIATFLFGLFLIFPTGCSQDDAMHSLEKAILTDNVLALDDGPGDLELKLKTDLKLQHRVFGLRDSIEAQMHQEFLLLQQLGRDILRQRGADPATAFSGGIDDPRLAMVPAAAQVMDSIGYEFYKQGKQILDVYPLSENGRGKDPSGIGIDPDDDPEDWWIDAQKDKQSDRYECMSDELSRIGGIVAALGAGAIWSGVSGKVVLGFVAVAGPSVTVSGAIVIGGFLYWGYRVERCITQKERQRQLDCSITITIEQDCINKINYGGSSVVGPDASDQGKFEAGLRMKEYEWCRNYLREVQVQKWSGLEHRLGDTLQLVLAQ